MPIEPHQSAADRTRMIWQLVDQGQVEQALSQSRQLNRDFPKEPGGWFTTAQIALNHRQPELALSATKQALKLSPGHPDLLLHYGLCLAAEKRYEVLIKVLQELKNKKFRRASQYTNLGALFSKVHQQADAVAPYQQAITLEPGVGHHHYNIACLYRSLGKVQEAEDHFDEAIRLNPKDYEAYKIRSEVRTQTLARNHIAELEQVLKQTTHPRGAVELKFALSKELEDLGDYRRSFSHLQKGATERRNLMQYNVNQDIATMEALTKAFGSDLFRPEQDTGRHPAGYPTEEPIFILGMPRTGTTLVERILSSHSKVTSAGELTNFTEQMMALLRQQAGNKRPDRMALIEQSTHLDFQELGKRYLSSTRPFTGEAEHFIDKLPLNYLYAGLIHLALPDARIINLVRHPMDTCYSVYKQLFTDAYPFSYDLNELGSYYVAYRNLMAHWHQVMPGVILEIEYENLVQHQERETRRLLDYCGLEMEPACLSFHKNSSPSTTASAVQVRQPIYQGSVGRWHEFARELAPLKRVLDKAGINTD